VLHTDDGTDEQALRKLFMRIDANSDGFVTWDEFCTYMLLESQGSANLRDLESSVSFEQAGKNQCTDFGRCGPASCLGATQYLGGQCP
jgi:Ca2+-binding EF-hand superfamily protein